MRRPIDLCLATLLRCGSGDVARLLTLVSFLACAGTAAAQGTDPHWAVHVAASPSWSLASFFEDLVDDGDEVNIEGTEFSIGVGRASTLGGDWGVSFVRKPFKNGPAVVNRSSECNTFGTQTVCSNSVETTFFNDVMLTGVEAHKFFSFVRIKDRVQLGLNVAGGIGSFDGEVTTVEEGQFPSFEPPNRIVLVSDRSEETNPASEELFELFPLLKLEAEGAVIVHPAFKIKIAGGLNFPGTGIRILGTYLIGAR
jgi:hypothetical protein